MHEFIAIAHTIINYLQAHWGAILALLGGSAGVSALTQVLIHKFKVDSKKVAYTLVHFLSFASGIVAYLAAQDNAVGVYAALVIGAQTVHRFFLSPAYTKYILPYLQYRSTVSPVAQPLPTEDNPFAAQ